MIVSMNVSHFVKICQILTILHQLICRGVANFGTRCILQRLQRRPSPTGNRHKKLAKFGHSVFKLCDRTDNILCNPNGTK